MALLLANDQYLKIDVDGNYIIYKDEAARLAHKKAVNSDKIIAKYNKILKSYNITEEVRYYNPSIISEFLQWHSEYNLYLSNLQAFNSNGHYPLMEKYYPTIGKSIPEIIRRGRIGVPKNATLEEIYLFVKENKIFELDENKVKDI